MDEKRFKEIEAVAISEVEASEYFELKKQKDYLKNYKNFPLKILYNSGAFTDEILINDSPFAFELKGILFVFGVYHLKYNDLSVFEGYKTQIKNVNYIFCLPDEEKALLLSKNLKDVSLCEEIYYKIFLHKVFSSDIKKIWVKNGNCLCVYDVYSKSYMSIQSILKCSCFIQEISSVFVMLPQ